MFKTVIPVIGLTLTPVYIASLVVTLVYRFIVHLWLRCTRPDYVGLLDIYEAWFNNENPSTLSIINVFANVRPTTVLSGEEFRKKSIDRVLRETAKQCNARLNCVIDKMFGLRVWRVGKTNIEEQVISLDATNSKEVEEYLSKVANVPIRNGRLFELHVGSHLIDGKYPLIFRAHHSMADGYAIRHLIMDDQITHSSVHAMPKTASAPKPKTTWKVIKDNFALASDVIKMFIFTPTMCIEQYLTPVEKNSLKAEALSGDKILRWRTGDLRILKEIKKMTKNTITEILLSAASKSLDDLFRGRGETVPHITVVFPMRKTQETSGLGNNFIPVALKLPLSTLNRELDIMEKIDELEQLPAHRMNYYLPRFAFVLLPMDIPEWAYRCTEVTSLFSNVPGPREKVAFNEFEVEEFAFFLPNLSKNNSLGIMLTSYVDKFVCSVIIDRKVVKKDDDAQKIVDGIMAYIDEVHRKL